MYILSWGPKSSFSIQNQTSDTFFGKSTYPLKVFRVVATQIFFIFTQILGEDEPILTNIFRMSWNHQLGISVPQKNRPGLMTNVTANGGFNVSRPRRASIGARRSLAERTMQLRKSAGFCFPNPLSVWNSSFPVDESLAFNRGWSRQYQDLPSATWMSRWKLGSKVRISGL